jgi:molybdate transport system permease protein
MFCGATKMKTETLPIAVFLNMSVGDIGMALSLTVILVILAASALLIFKALGGRGYLW